MGRQDSTRQALQDRRDRKSRWRRYQPRTRSTLHRRSDLRTGLRDSLHRARGSSLDDGGLAVHYQPIVDLSYGTIRGYEALLRWTHPTRGEIPAADVIAVAEETGLIMPLGTWVLNRAMAEAAPLIQAVDSTQRYLSVNVSPTQLCQPGFIDQARDVVAAAPVHPSQLVIELTETQPLGDDDSDRWGVLGELHEMGIRIAVDDYGTGHAALGYLQQPIFDIVKLDRSFLRGISNSRNRSLIRYVVGLAGELGIDLIAEGIEDDATRSALVELGCTVGQGYMFAPAMTLSHALRWTP